MHTLPRRPAALPVAPRSIDAELLRKLLASPAKIGAYALVLAENAAHLQRAISTGRWYSRRDLQNTQRMTQTVLIAARATKTLAADDLKHLDALTEFARGEPITASNAQVAA